MAASAYDDDETSEPVGFEQDPDSDDFGDGYFTYTDGSRRYGSNAEAAQSLDQQGKATRVAYAGDPSSPYANAIAANEGATGSAAGGTDAPAPAAPPPSAVSPAPPAPAPAAPAKPPVLDMDEEAAKQAAAPPSAGAAAAPAIPPPPLAVSGKREGTTAHDEKSHSASESATRTGSAEPLEQFNEQQAAIHSAYDQAKQHAEQGSNDEATLIAQHAAQLRQDALAREAATAAAQQQRDARAQAVQQKINDVASRKTDDNKLWKDKGVFGTMLGFLGVLAGSIESTKFKTPNEALKSIEEQKKQNIQSQMEDRNSELRGLERELGSLDAAVPVFEARMNQAIAQKLEANLSDERSQVAKTNGQRLVDQLNIDGKQKLAEGAKAYYGTLARNQAVQGSSSSSVGSEASVDQSTRPSADAIKAYIDYQADLTKQGYTPEQQAPILRAKFGQLADFIGTPKGEPENRKRSDEQGKVEGAIAGLDQYAKVSELKFDVGTGKYSPPKGREDEPLPTTVAGRLQLGPSAYAGGAEREQFDKRTKAFTEGKSAAMQGLSGAGLKSGILEHDPLDASTLGELAERLNEQRALLAPRRSAPDRAAPIDARALGGKKVQ